MNAVWKLAVKDYWPVTKSIVASGRFVAGEGFLCHSGYGMGRFCRCRVEYERVVANLQGGSD